MSKAANVCGVPACPADRTTLTAVVPGVQMRSQEVHLLQVLERGRLVWVQRLGQHCWDDDAMLLANQAEAERRWQAEQAPPCQAASILDVDMSVSVGNIEAPLSACPRNRHVLRAGNPRTCQTALPWSTADKASVGAQEAAGRAGIVEREEGAEAGSSHAWRSHERHGQDAGQRCASASPFCVARHVLACRTDSFELKACLVVVALIYLCGS